ncbi:hypothetical protein K449DRAFT_438563 [Hypoxylon sp. EC38]|nr:hypothetical protein K449DRAFT_438563 [Hypoxylon sp. EC38]
MGFLLSYLSSTSLVTVFRLINAHIQEKGVEIVSGTMAYAAVLIVFVSWTIRIWAE